jgi:hypothetical protein
MGPAARLRTQMEEISYGRPQIRRPEHKRRLGPERLSHHRSPLRPSASAARLPEIAPRLFPGSGALSAALLRFGAVVGHISFDKIETSEESAFDSHAYGHYLHHKYFEVNYGDGLVPLDKLFCAWRDGAPEADARMNADTRSARRASTRSRPPAETGARAQNRARRSGLTRGAMRRRAPLPQAAGASSGRPAHSV